jgi:hypothetical protein
MGVLNISLISEHLEIMDISRNIKIRLAGRK